jgi:hypothetical protein
LRMAPSDGTLTGANHGDEYEGPRLVTCSDAQSAGCERA